MTASIIIFTKKVDSAMLISAKALKFKPDSSLLKKYTIIGWSKDEARTKKQSAPATDLSKASFHKDTAKMDSLQREGIKKAVVWIKKDSSIVKRVIKIGLNDDANVEVVSGLTADDEVIDGIGQQGSVQTTANSTVKSPFLPQRPGSGNAGSQKKATQTR
jgi:HlyD family secretion protein